MDFSPTLSDYQPERRQALYASGDNHAFSQMDGGHVYIHPTLSHSLPVHPASRPTLPVSSQSCPPGNSFVGSTQYLPSSTRADLPPPYINGSAPLYSPNYHGAKPQPVFTELASLTAEPDSYDSPGPASWGMYKSDQAIDSSLLESPTSTLWDLLDLDPTTPADSELDRNYCLGDMSQSQSVSDIVDTAYNTEQGPYTTWNTTCPPPFGSEVADLTQSRPNLDGSSHSYSPNLMDRLPPGVRSDSAAAPPLFPPTPTVAERQTALTRFTAPPPQGMDYSQWKSYVSPAGSRLGVYKSGPANDPLSKSCNPSVSNATPSTPADSEVVARYPGDASHYQAQLGAGSPTAHNTVDHRGFEELKQEPYTDGNTNRSPLVGEVLDFGTFCRVDLLLAKNYEDAGIKDHTTTAFAKAKGELGQKMTFRTRFLHDPNHGFRERQVNVCGCREGERIQPTKGALATLAAQAIQKYAGAYALQLRAPFPYAMNELWLCSIKVVSTGSLQVRYFCRRPSYP